MPLNNGLTGGDVTSVQASTNTTEKRGTTDQPFGADFIGLSDAGKRSPGRPHPSCVWRWCRKGIKSRSGDRVKLRHVRIGGKIYTKAAWLEEFWQALADRDAAHFDARLAVAATTPPREPQYAPPSRRRARPEREAAAPDRHVELENELNKEGF